MRLTSKNLTRHETLFGEIGPNQGVLIREQRKPHRGDEMEVIAEACKLLVWGDAKEGWTKDKLYWPEPCPSVETLIEHCPELARHHYVPSDWVYWW